MPSPPCISHGKGGKGIIHSDVYLSNISPSTRASSPVGCRKSCPLHTPDSIPHNMKFPFDNHTHFKPTNIFRLSLLPLLSCPLFASQYCCASSVLFLITLYFMSFISLRARQHQVLNLASEKGKGFAPDRPIICPFLFLLKTLPPFLLDWTRFYEPDWNFLKYTLINNTLTLRLVTGVWDCFSWLVLCSLSPLIFTIPAVKAFFLQIEPAQFLIAFDTISTFLFPPCYAWCMTFDAFISLGHRSLVFSVLPSLYAFDNVNDSSWCSIAEPPLPTTTDYRSCVAKLESWRVRSPVFYFQARTLSAPGNFCFVTVSFIFNFWEPSVVFLWGPNIFHTIRSLEFLFFDFESFFFKFKSLRIPCYDSSKISTATALFFHSCFPFVFRRWLVFLLALRCSGHLSLLGSLIICREVSAFFYLMHNNGHFYFPRFIQAPENAFWKSMIGPFCWVVAS